MAGVEEKSLRSDSHDCKTKRRNHDLKQVVKPSCNGSPEFFIPRRTISLNSVLEKLLNELMKIEREAFIGAGVYERSEDRKGHCNGFKDKKLITRSGEPPLKVPQTRGIAFYLQCLERGERSERALKLALAEMYFSGVSTRKVKQITGELCGIEISSTQVSR